MNVDIGGGTCPAEGHVNLDPIHGEGVWRRYIEQGIPVADAALDGIFSSHCFEHVHNRIDLFNEMHRALRPGGLLEFIVPVVGWTGEDGIDTWNPRGWRPFADPTHVSWFWWPTSLLYFTDQIEVMGVSADYPIKRWNLLEADITPLFDGHAIMEKP